MLVPSSRIALDRVRIGFEFDLGEPLEALLNQMVDNQPRPLGFRQSVQDAVDDASHHNRGDGNNGGGQTVSFEIREDFFYAAVFTELIAVECQLDAGEVLTPFVVERPVPSPAVRHPETTALKNNSVSGAHKPTPPEFPPQPGKPAYRSIQDSVREAPDPGVASRRNDDVWPQIGQARLGEERARQEFPENRVSGRR
jgi:hypothetical protein